jgi:hypothetical protein
MSDSDCNTAAAASAAGIPETVYVVDAEQILRAPADIRAIIQAPRPDVLSVPGLSPGAAYYPDGDSGAFFCMLELARGLNYELVLYLRDGSMDKLLPADSAEQNRFRARAFQDDSAVCVVWRVVPRELPGVRHGS